MVVCCRYWCGDLSLAAHPIRLAPGVRGQAAGAGRQGQLISCADLGDEHEKLS